MQTGVCGLAGYIRFDGQPAERGIVETMTAALAHRGPDDAGFYSDFSIALGFRRLAIMDLSDAGHQPMKSPDGRFVIIFNGEIYNYVELREELRGLGYDFRSSGDTEVLLRAYQAWGADCLARLNGMWAFLIYDRRRRTIFGSRDRFGVKPLYLYRADNAFLFASEIKGILASGLLPSAEVNWAVAARYLLLGQLDDYPRQTFYKEIEQIPPGTAFEITLPKGIREWLYWTLDGLDESSIDDAPERFVDLFEDAIRLRLRSDVPVGVCLSGGLDSTSIICSMARHRAVSSADLGLPLHAFSFVDEDFDESRYIHDTLQMACAVSHRLEIRPDRIWSATQEAIQFHDEPFHSATALMGFELMRLAKASGIKVVMNGQGADEAIGGYSPYFRDYWFSLFRSARFAHLAKSVVAYSRGRREHLLPLLGTIATRAAREALREIPLLRASARPLHLRKIRSGGWYSAQITGAYEYRSQAHPTSLRQSLINSVQGSWLRLYLRLEDRNSMAHSVEVRLPFMDYRLVSFVCSLPDDWKIRGPWNKYILRHAMKGRIPEAVRTRVDKFGFPVPIDRWFKTALHGPMNDLLSDARTRSRGLYNIDAVRRSLVWQKEGRLDAGASLYRLAQFELWLRSLESKGPSRRNMWRPSPYSTCIGLSPTHGPPLAR